jgi:hypothetical protein
VAEARVAIIDHLRSKKNCKQYGKISIKNSDCVSINSWLPGFAVNFRGAEGERKFKSRTVQDSKL